MSINKSAIVNKIVSGMSAIESTGESKLEDMVQIWIDAIIDEIKSNGEVKVDNTGGTCTYSGGHPPVHSEGKIY